MTLRYNDWLNKVKWEGLECKGRTLFSLKSHVSFESRKYSIRWTERSPDGCEWEIVRLQPYCQNKAFSNLNLV